MEQRRVAAVAEVELTRGAKGEYRWVVKTAATDGWIAVEEVVAMDAQLRERYYPEEIDKKEERDGG